MSDHDEWGEFETAEREYPGFCPECGAPPDVGCNCPCDLCAESGLIYCACDDDDDAGYPIPDEFDDDDNEHDFTTEEDVVT